MKRPQPALFVDRDTQLWTVLEKVRSSGILSLDEMVLLDEVVKVNAPVDSEDVRWLCAVWRAEYEKATLARAPRLTATELHALKDASKRVGGAGELGRLMPAFFAWRRWLVEQKAAAPQPTTIGLQKHLASLQEFAAKMTREASRLVEERRRVKERAAASAGAGEGQPAVAPEEVRRFRRKLEGGLTPQQTNERRQLLKDQVEQLQQKAPERGLGG